MVESVQKIGIVAYDEVSNDKNVFQNAFATYYAKTGLYDFAVSWSSIDELMKYIRESGVATLNELSRILVLDQAFENRLDTTNIVNKFVSLEELMYNRSVTHPILTYATGQQEVYDLFKRKSSPEGHPLFPYEKTRVNRIKTGANNAIPMGQFTRILNGEMDDNALAIRNDYTGRETVARQQVENFKKHKLNGRAGEIDNVIERLKQGENNGEPEGQAGERLTNKEVKDVIKKAKEKKRQEELAKNYRPKEKEIRQEKARLHADKVTDLEKNQNKSISSQLLTLANNLRSANFALNFNNKLYNDRGIVIFGGLMGSGCSSVVANLAMFYALMEKKVLIANLSSSDHITRYFKSYHQRYNELNRKQSLITRGAKTIKEISVPVAKNIELISDFGAVQKAYTIKQRLTNYNQIMMASGYDIVIVLAGDNFEPVFLQTNQEYINDVVLVSPQADLQELGLDLITNTNKLVAKEKYLKHPLGLIINQIQYYESPEVVQRNILSLDPPLDRLRLIGEITHEDNWFLQARAGVPLVATSSLVKNYFTEIAKNIIFANKAGE